MSEKGNKPAKRPYVKTEKWEKARSFDLQVAPEQSNNLLRTALENFGKLPVKYSDREEIQIRTRDYFERCCERETKPSMVGLANALGVNKRILNDWRIGRQGDQWIREYASKIYQLFEELTVGYLQDGMMFAPSAMFLLKSSFHYSDQPTPLQDEQVPRASSEISMDEVLAIANGKKAITSTKFSDTKDD